MSDAKWRAGMVERAYRRLESERRLGADMIDPDEREIKRTMEYLMRVASRRAARPQGMSRD